MFILQCILIMTSGLQDFRTSGLQDIRTSGLQDIRTSGHQNSFIDVNSIECTYRYLNINEFLCEASWTSHLTNFDRTRKFPWKIPFSCRKFPGTYFPVSCFLARKCATLVHKHEKFYQEFLGLKDRILIQN